VCGNMKDLGAVRHLLGSGFGSNGGRGSLSLSLFTPSLCLFPSSTSLSHLGSYYLNLGPLRAAGRKGGEPFEAEVPIMSKEGERALLFIEGKFAFFALIFPLGNLGLHGCAPSFAGDTKFPPIGSPPFLNHAGLFGLDYFILIFSFSAFFFFFFFFFMTNWNFHQAQAFFSCAS